MRLLFALALVAAASASTPAVEGLLAQYRTTAPALDAARGAALWKKASPAPDGGAARACTTCHGATLASPGKHATTGEPIAPMNAPDRLTDAAKIEKWFGRNCRWTYGRDCTPQEKGDFLLFLTAGGAR